MTQSALAIASSETAQPGVAAGGVNLILRLEGGAALALAAGAYQALHASWLVFALLFLVPDLSMLGYLANPRLGARVYNFGHSYLSPTALALAGAGLHEPALFGPALIWAAHIGFDRTLGFGLKYPLAFRLTHLSAPRPAP